MCPYWGYGQGDLCFLLELLQQPAAERRWDRE
jgi:hypothetical protein